LFAWGPTGGVEFSDFEIDGDEPRVFVVMQFGSPYDDLYREVIERISKKLGLATLRGDDVFANSSSIILQDIIRNIKESDIIIAEITPVNANVFYELGYAHAMNKPTILLANRTVEKLPFDVSGYRVIFYDDTIRGRRDIEENLEKHLENVVKGFGAVRRGSPTMAN
jgi:cobalamin biosynthesis Co2+ chelatase CbiK